jgi:hypothetical protein
MLAFANCHQLHEQGRTIPSFFMRKWSVDLFNPSLVAALCGPESTHLVSCKIERICSRSTCARVWGFMFPCPGAIRERRSRSGTCKTQPGERITARSITFSSSRMFPGPVIPFTAPPPGLEGYVVNGEKVRSTHMMRATVPFNVTGLPALSVPFMFSSEQLPINVQLVSRWLDEATILHLGELIEAGNKAQYRHPNL